MVECRAANGGNCDGQSVVRGSCQTAVMAGSARLGAACFPGDTGRRADGRRRRLKAIVSRQSDRLVRLTDGAVFDCLESERRGPQPRRLLPLGEVGDADPSVGAGTATARSPGPAAAHVGIALIPRDGGGAVAAQTGSIAVVARDLLARAIVAQGAQRAACTVRHHLPLALEHLAGAEAPGAGEPPEFAQASLRLFHRRPATHWLCRRFHRGRSFCFASAIYLSGG